MVHLALPSGSSQISPEPTTILVDVYSAVSDTLTIEDLDTGDTAECVTDANGVGTATLTAGHEYCFTSSKASGLDGHSNYCKYITPDEDTTEISVMPEGSLYWYGNECTDKTGGWSKDGYNPQASWNPTISGPTKNVNDMTITRTTSMTSDCTCFGTGNAIDTSTYSKLSVFGETNGNKGAIGLSSSKQNYDDNKVIQQTTPSGTSGTLYELNISSLTSNLYMYFSTGSALNFYIKFKSIWLEKKRTITNPQNVTLTLEGAKEDKITIYDKSWNVVDYVDFASGSTTATKTIAIKQGGEELIFVSNVAKNTDGDGQYSKVVEVSSDATVKLMPDDAIYWYGYNEGDFEAFTYSAKGTATKNTNSLYLAETSGGGSAIVAKFVARTSVSLAAYSTLHIITQSSHQYIGYVQFATSRYTTTSGIPDANMVAQYLNSETDTSIKHVTIDVSGKTQSVYAHMPITSPSSFSATANHYALWLE